MATGGGAGSTLSNLAQKRRVIDKTRQALRLDSSNAGASGQVRPPAPPPPANTTSEATAPAVGAVDQAQQAAQQAGAPAPTSEAQRDPALLKIAQDHLDEIRNAGKPTAPNPAPTAMAPPTVPLTLPEQIAGVGAQNYSPEQQFMRLNGRPPAPREMVIYNAAQQLTQQLGRAPTRNEVLMYVTRGADVNNGPEPAIM